MKKTKILLLAAMALSTMGLQSCLQFDEPGDEFEQTTIIDKPNIVKGEADKIDYKHLPTEENFNKAINDLNNEFYAATTGLYAMRGGKEGGLPEAHSYQYQYVLSTDNYCQFSTVPHSDFMYGTLKSTLDVSKDFNGGPKGCYLIQKKAIAPILNNGLLDTIPELKALYLLMFNYGAIELSDIYGPMPYANYKANQDESPFEYQALRDIYYSAVENVDTIVKALRAFPDRPQWYKDGVQNVMFSSFQLWKNNWEPLNDLERWARFANSFKLRLAIHVSKVEPETAKKWAEEAVASGVIENAEDEIGIYPYYGAGFNHPLMQISDWGDTRISASWESLLMSLDHPYTKYLFEKNSDPINRANNAIAESSAPEQTPARSRIIGIRSGTVPGIGQAVGSNEYIAFSTWSKDVMGGMMPPLYLMKLSEVNFLRAEGALRGWNMGGTAQHFYEEGIRYAGIEERAMGPSQYDQMLDEYMSRTEPVDYTYVDPTGRTPDMPSVTKIGVKWDESESNEVKLEKIITQKYIASWPYSYEPWVDLRRTGYPKLFPILNPEDGDGSLKYGDIIRRMPWAESDPQIIQDLNDTGLPNLGEGATDTQGQRLWWDVDAPNF